MKNKHIDTFLTSLTNSGRFDLFTTIPFKQFWSLSNWPHVQSKIPRHIVIWLYLRPLKAASLQVKYDTSFALPLNGFLHYLYSDVLLVGYIIDMPKTTLIEVQDTYTAITAKGKIPNPTSPQDVNPVSHILHDANLSIYHQANGLVIACTDQTLINHLV